MTAEQRLVVVTCFTHGTMTHLTRCGNRTLCGARVAQSCSTGSTTPTDETVDMSSACQRHGCRQAWNAWVEAGGTLDEY